MNEPRWTSPLARGFARMLGYNPDTGEASGKARCTYIPIDMDSLPKNPFDVLFRPERTATKITTLLKGLEAAFPPPPKCHHALTYNTYGGEDRLGLHMWIDGVSHTFFVEHEDLDVPLEELVTNIKALTP